MIPLSGWLSRAFSTRWLFTASAASFTLASIVCGFAWNIQSMIAARAIQGFVGGAMIPTVFATGYALFTGKKRALIPGDAGPAQQPGPDARPDAGRLDHRHALVALALLRQHRAGPRHHVHDSLLRGDRRARSFAAPQVRFHRPRAAGRFAGQPRICAGGRLSLELAG